MIRKLRVKIILLASLISFVVLAVIVAGMNTANFVKLKETADRTLILLSENKGRFPEPGEKPSGDKGDPGHKPPLEISPETPYVSRYFIVTQPSGSEELTVDLSHTASIDREEALAYAERVEGRAGRGYADSYRYMSYSDADGRHVIFLDVSRDLDSSFNFLTASLLASLGGFVILIIIILVWSGKIVRPIAESYEKQKQFITDAGHEMKTPIAIISANVELLSSEIGKNELLTDISYGVRRLASLTEELTSLARMEEHKLTMLHLPLTELVRDTASAYKVRAVQHGAELDIAVEEGIFVLGDSASCEKLVSILLDNAIKYRSPNAPRITLSLSRRGAVARLCVENASINDMTDEDVSHVFDRFWRYDRSRSPGEGGYGVGLSMAKAIVEAHSGRISAAMRDERIFSVTALIPISHEQK